MDIENFVSELREAIELDDDVQFGPDTVLKDLNEWDSLSVLTTMAMVSTNYNKVIEMEDIEKCDTVQSLFEAVKAK